MFPVKNNFIAMLAFMRYPGVEFNFGDIKFKVRVISISPLMKIFSRAALLYNQAV